MSENRSVTVSLRAEIGQYASAMRQAASETRALALEMQRTGTAKQRQGLRDMSLAAVGFGLAVEAGIGVAINRFADFDHEMSAVQAATHETARSMQLLRNEAIRAGQDTKFSATEAAQGEEALAKAGVSTANILGGGLQGALDLAAAGNQSVADSAETAATAMTQFALSGADIPHVADLLAAGAGKAQGEVSDLAEALKYVGPVAHGMGISIEETVGVLAEFASKGIIGEQAGTGFRGMLLSLTSPSVQAKDKMHELGIELYDANGQFIGMQGTAKELRDALAPLPEAERNMALGILFGNQQVTAARVLFDGGAKSVRNWTREVNDAGYASETARIKMDNLQGDLEQLRGSLETALIQTGSSANGTLRGLTQAGTGAVNAFSELPAPLQATAVGVAAVGGAVVLMLGAVGTIGPRVAVARASLEGLGASGRRASAGIGLLGRLGGVTAVVVGVGTALHFIGDEITRLEGKAAPTVDNLTASLVQMATDGRVTGELLDTFGSSAKKLAEDLDLLSGGSGAISKWANLTSGGLFGREWRQAKDDIDSLDKSLAGLVEGGHADTAASIFETLGAQVVRNGGKVSDLKARLNDYRDALTRADTQQKLTGDSADQLGGAVDGVAQATDQAATEVETYKDVLDRLNGVNLTAYEQQTALKRSMADLHNETKKAGQVTLDERDALASFARQANDTANAIQEQTGNTEKANRVLQTSRKRFIDAAVSAGYTRGEAKKLANEFFRLPPSKTTVIKTPGLETAISRASTLLSILRNIDAQNPAVTVTVNTQGGIVRGGRGASGRQGRAAGGYISGPGTSTSDSIPINASNGEYVVRASAVRAVGVGTLHAINRLGYAGGGLVGFAEGGTVDIAAILAAVTGGYGTADAVASARAGRVDADRGVIASRRSLRDANHDLATSTRELHSLERQLHNERQKAHPDRKKVRDLEQQIRDQRWALLHATERQRDAELDLADARTRQKQATQDVAAAQNAYRASQERPTTALSRGLALDIKDTGAFMSSLKTLAGRGFGELAQQLLAVGGPEAERLAADAVKLNQSSLSNLNTQVTTAAAQQSALSLLPTVLNVITQLNKGGQPGLLDMAKALGISWQDVAAAVASARSDVAAAGHAAKLLAELDKLPRRAAGGALYGLGSGTSDSNLWWGSAGEHVWSAAEVAAAGGHAAMADARARALAGGVWGGRIPLAARGGTAGTAANTRHFSFTVTEAPTFDEHQALRMVAMAEALLAPTG